MSDIRNSLQFLYKRFIAEQQLTQDQPKDSFQILLDSIAAGDGRAESLGLFERVYQFMQERGSSPVLLEMNNRLRSNSTALIEDQVDRGQVLKFISLAFIVALYERLTLQWQRQTILSQALSQLHENLLRMRHRREDEEEWDEYHEEVERRRNLEAKTHEIHEHELDVLAKELAAVLNDVVAENGIKPGKPITAAEVKSALNTVNALGVDTAPVAHRERTASLRHAKKGHRT